MGVREDRADMRSSIYGGEQALDALYVKLARAVRDAVERHAERKGDAAVITPLARQRILSDVSDALQAIYPSRRGAPSVLEELIVASCAAVSMKPILRAQREIEAADPELARALAR